MPFGQSILIRSGMNALLEDARERCIPKYRQQCRIAVVGRTGTGKSTLINAIFGKQVSLIGDYEPVTKKVESYDLGIESSQFCVIDTPGIGDSEIDYDSLDYLRSEIEQVDSVFFVSRLAESSVSGDEKRAIQLISEQLGTKIWERSLIVFTFSDCVETSQHAIALEKRTELLRQVIANYADVSIACNVASVAVNNRDETVIFFAGHGFNESEQLQKEFRDSSETRISKLLESLTTEDVQARLKAILALGKIGAEQAVPSLCNILATDQNPEIRRGAAEALGMIGSKEAEAKR